jgi:carboxylate-amine ligase
MLNAAAADAAKRAAQDHRAGQRRSAPTSEAFTFGIEEEYFLVDAESKSSAPTVPHKFWRALEDALGDQVTGELLQSQLEVATVPHADAASARADLRRLRRTVAEIGRTHGLAILASGTHPTAIWRQQRQSPGERYDAVMDDLQMLGRRNMLCGLHVHVELPDPDGRVPLMMRMLPYLPLFVALATSSPFWQSQLTGLKGYRLAAYDELPRSGVPELFRSKDEYETYVAALVKAGIIPDASFVWWAIRPSLKHPTLELRAPDCCTQLEDTLAIASLYRALARHLWRNPALHGDLTSVDRAIVIENKWRAQRYGVHGTLAEAGGPVRVADRIAEVVEMVTPDAEALNCLAELRHCRAIAAAGTSADQQLAVYAAHEISVDPAQALRAVTDWLALTTLQ